MRVLAQDGIVAGETWAGGLAGMLRVIADEAGTTARSLLNFGPDTRILLLCTEGAIDHDAYQRLIAGR